MRFLGWTQEGVVDRIAQTLRPVASACAPADVPLGALGMFPERGSPRVLWVGMDLPERTLALQRACEEAARREGFPPEERAFTPHLTLGRWKARTPRPQLPAADLGTTRIERLTLFKSDLRPSGAIYTPLHVFDLGR